MTLHLPAQMKTLIKYNEYLLVFGAQNVSKLTSTKSNTTLWFIIMLIEKLHDIVHIMNKEKVIRYHFEFEK